ncbi:(2Fe-2S) ferredoxin domain-containing protein [Waterburya agarophytonicola K14]|uniref:(2Fe-2S) ferredoxin domain-containing protein n=1 Tax=Waterburya agarophytonicola KI4 TaxID=2874699 RepID=A0A964BN54_9CYAN|nr:(2Fe-2S) ferredoxin domain-containing protein [Waterburya agarophytonicola]MCC0175403.1 (2Fe-2S) ferredoxin domain-containing protein [Waterburya agarophytonicola KI4]
MMTITPLISEFIATGELKELSAKSDGRIKYLLLSTEQEEYWIKVAKDQPKNLHQKLNLGCELKVKGMLKRKVKQDVAEYKAYSIEVLTPATVEDVPQEEVSTAKPSKSKQPKAKVLICQKANCWNKGGKEVYEELKSELEKRGIAENVEIKTTGCLKRCKKAPNVIMLPDKKQYVRVKPKQIPAIVDAHMSELTLGS